MEKAAYSIERTVVYILSLIAFIGVIDTSFLISIISPYARQLGASEFEAGLIAGLYSIVAIPASVLAGLLMDKIGRWRLLRLGLTLDFLSMLLYYFSFTPYMLMGVRVLHAIGGSMLFPSGVSLVARYSRERIAPGVSTFLIFIALSVVAGSLTSATIVSFMGFKPVFLLLSVIIGLGGLMSFFIPSFLEVNEVTHRKLDFRVLKMYGANTILSITFIFTLYLAFGFFVGGYPTVLAKSLGLSEERVSSLIGMFIGISTLISIPLMYFTGYLLQRGFLRLVNAVGLVSLALSTGILILNLSIVTHMVSALILSVSIGMLMVSSTYLAVNVDDTIRGVTSALHQTFNILGVAIGAPLSGLLASIYLGEMFIIPLAMTVLALVYSLIVDRKVVYSVE